MTDDRPDRSAASIVFAVLLIFVLTVGGLTLLRELLEGNLF